MMVRIQDKKIQEELPWNAPVAIDYRALAHRDPWTMPIEEIDVSNPYIYQDDTWGGFFARLRRDEPVHFINSPMYGPYWSVTRYRDIMRVDTSHRSIRPTPRWAGSR